jgi:dienelactone hydrolase
VLISGPPVAWGLENAYSMMTRDGEGADLPQAEIERRIAATAPSGFDPQPYIRDMKMPTLWMFGGNDQSIPARLCAAAIDTLRAEGHANLERIFYEKGAHALWETERGTMIETPLVKRYVPGFLDDLKGWLERHLAG